MSKNLKKTSITNELARERNRAATDRTLMAWIRTALPMIDFGFGVGKIYDALGKAIPVYYFVDFLETCIPTNQATTTTR